MGKAREGHLGKCETVKRVREAIRAAGHTSNFTWEIGTRTNQADHCFPEGITAEEYWKFNDETHADLDDHENLVRLAPSDPIFREGSVIHVYVTKNIGTVQLPEWELWEVLTIWIGTKSEPWRSF